MSMSMPKSKTNLSTPRVLLGLGLAAALGVAAAYLPGGAAQAQTPPAAKPPAPAAGGVAGGKPAAEAPKCKTWGNKPQCCDPAVMAHLPKEAIFKACDESEATFLGEQGQKDTCKYVFKVQGEKEEDTFVQVYAPALKDVPPAPQEPFFQYKKIGKVSVTEKAKTPKMAATIANSTGLYLPGKGYAV